MLRTATRTLKFQVLERRLGSRILAVGVLELLWHTTAENAPDGGIGRFTDEEIEVAIGWTGNAGELVAMLIETRWLDRVEGPRLYVHDWHDHADRSVHMKLGRDGRRFANGDAPNLGHLEPKDRAKGTERLRANDAKASGVELPCAPRVHAEHTDDAHALEGQGQGHKARSKGQEEADSQKNTHKPPAGGSAAPAAGRKASITRIWELGIAAAALYRETAKTWVLTDARKKHVRALFSEHTAEGEEILAKVVHGYRYARRQWDDIEQHFEADTLLRASNRTKYLEAYREAIAKGLAPPFARASSAPMTTDPARAARVERDAEIQRLYRAARLRESTPAALAEWEAAGRPDAEWWWLPEGERRRVTPADIAALRGNAAPKQTASAPLSTAEVEAKRAELRGQARAVGGRA